MRFWATRKEVQELRQELYQLEQRLTDLSFRTGWGYSFSIPVRPPKSGEVVTSTAVLVPPVRTISTTEMLSALMSRLNLHPYVSETGPVTLKRKKPE